MKYTSATALLVFFALTASAAPPKPSTDLKNQPEGRGMAADIVGGALELAGGITSGAGAGKVGGALSGAGGAVKSGGARGGRKKNNNRVRKLKAAEERYKL